MKNQYFFCCLLSIFVTTNLRAQIKVFSGGNITVGGITTPVTGFTMHLYGNSLFSSTSFTGVSGNSAALIRGLDTYSNASGPDYTWWGDYQTGIFHPAFNFIGFCYGRNESMRITDKGNLLVGGTYDANFRVCINNLKDKTALGTFCSFSADYGYAHISYVDNQNTKNWDVQCGDNEEFYVLGDGTVWARAGYTTSDSTLKENVTGLQNSRNKILQLRGVSFTFIPEIVRSLIDSTPVISNTLPKTQIGLIAQEVERVIPEVVATNDKGIKGIAYPNLVALLIEAFKEESATIDSLKAQIAECCASGGSSFRIRSGDNSDASQNKSSVARLDQNKPNPFSSETKISFYIPENSNSKTLLVFDMQGTLMKQYQLPTNGESFINIPGGEYKAGMYLYTLLIDGKEIDTKRMILIN